MPVRDPGATSNRPPQMADAMPSAGAIAARRSEPGVCAVPRSNSAGLTMWIAAGEPMMSPFNLDLQREASRRPIREPLNWGLRSSLPIAPPFSGQTKRRRLFNLIGELSLLQRALGGGLARWHETALRRVYGLLPQRHPEQADEGDHGRRRRAD